MPRKSAHPKTVLIATRVTPRIKAIIEQMAIREGLSVSEWLRNLIVVELKKNEALPAILKMPEYTIEEIKVVSEQIKVIPEQEDTSEEFEVAFKKMEAASEIYFLGFGYHPDNLRRLKIKKFDKKHPTGTALGLGETERDEIFAYWGIKLHEEHNEILEFLKNRISL